MASKIRIPTPLRKLTDNQESIEVESNTIGGAIDELEGKFNKPDKLQMRCA